MNIVCCIFRCPAPYCEPIYKLMEREFDIDWYFGDDEGNIKCYDAAVYEQCSMLPESKHLVSLYYGERRTAA